MDCSGCGKCCSKVPYLQLTRSDVKRIVKKYPELQKTFKKVGAFHVLDLNYMQCPFQDKTTLRCKIYDVRPSHCRSFPIEMDDMDTRYTNRVKDRDYDLHPHVTISITCDHFETFTEREYRDAFQNLVSMMMRFGNVGVQAGMDKMKLFKKFHDSRVKKPLFIQRRMSYIAFNQFKGVPGYIELLKLVARWKVDTLTAKRFLERWTTAIAHDPGKVSDAIDDLKTLINNS